MGIKTWIRAKQHGRCRAEFVYMPKDDGTHYVDGMLTKDDKEIGRLTGVYDSKG